jgi:glutathione synthase/RimK-type ligase-like ATP-grasp enzyme
MIGPVAIVFSIPSPDMYPFTENLTRDSYQLLAKLAKEKNIELRFVLGEKNIVEDTFTSYWKFDGDKIVHIREEFKAACVYLQTREFDVLPMKRVNSPYLEEICLDKYKTFQVFKKFTKRTLLVTDSTSVDSLTTDLVVVKPQFGSLGYRIHIIKKDDFDPKNFLDEKYIVQEFIDSSSGIDGLISQRHELRTYIFNGELKATYLRLPAKNSYIANIAKGAIEQQIDSSQIPSSLQGVIEYVDNYFKTIQPRLYTIDIMFENNKPWIVELNDMPGMPDISVQPLTNTYFHAMLDLFKES